ncbi:MAG: hypothetical protein RMH84_01910 [Sulfolobales archaeon]|nr:hypothetical protein [Sulfolobales archaeon]MDW8010335.1 hypothetical protein [Sulfolobales archaeon]
MSAWSDTIRRTLKLDPDKDLVLDLVKRLVEGRGSVIVSSAGLYRGIGKYFAHLMNSLTSVSVFYVEPYELAYYVAPYYEGRELDVLLISTSEGLNDLYVLLDQLSLTGHRVSLISEPLPEVLKRRYEDLSRVEIKLDNMGLLKVLSVLAYAASKLSRRDLQKRADRIRDECLSLADVADELVERYERELKAIREALSEPYIVTYTPTLEPAAEAVSLRMSCGRAYMTGIPTVHLYVGSLFNKVLAFTTDVEVHSYRYYFNKVVERGGRIEEVRFRTDPLTAPLYAVMLIYYAARGV